MEKLYASPAFQKIAIVLMKVIEILYWIGSLGMLLLMLYGLFNPSALPELAAGLRSSGQDLVIGSYSLEMNTDTAALANQDLVLFLFACMLMMCMIAMIFRNLYLIFRRSESGTPFDSDSIRMMGEIGIFSILIPVIGLLFNVILHILHFFDSGTAVMTVYMDGIILGIIVFFIAGFFVRGHQLEEDVEGLI